MSIEDFGAKIGGAKKDLWKMRGLNLTDLLEMNDAEKDKFVKKDNVWKKPDYDALVSGGLPIRVAYFMKLMRDAVMDLKTEDDVRNFKKTFINLYITRNPHSSYVSLKPEAFDCITNKMLRHASYAERSFYDIDKDIKNKKFCYTEDEKILAAFSFYLYNKDSVEFTKDYSGQDTMEVSSWATSKSSSTV